MKRAAFLFGSGISLASGAPTVEEISDALLNHGWHDEGEFRFSPSDTESTDTALRAQKFLRILKNYIETHLILRENRNAHYEDLYAAAVQIFQDEISEIIDPMLRHSVAEIRSSVVSLYQDQEVGNYPNAFARLVHSATLLINWGVFHLLCHAKNPKGMKVLTSVANATEQMDIFSLNHDLLIERQLEQGEIKFSDGFSEKDGDVIKYNGSWNSDNIPVRLYKLHGSLDWYRFTFPGCVNQFARVPKMLDPLQCKGNEGLDLELSNPVPLFLIGTNGKERLYGIGFVAEFFYEFRSRLEQHHTLICCGYGWADKGINNRLNQWLQNSIKNRIVILHDSSKVPLDTLKQKQFWSKPGDYSNCNRWNEWEQNGRLVVVHKWLGCCTLNDLESFFDDYEQQLDAVQLL